MPKRSKLGRPLTPRRSRRCSRRTKPASTRTGSCRRPSSPTGSDGCLQTRSQGDDIVLDDLGLTADLTAAPGPVADPPAKTPPDHPRWWSAAGRPTTTRAGSLRSTSRSSTPAGPTSRPPRAARGQLAEVVISYDPRGLAVRTRLPGRIRTAAVPGNPPDLTDPDQYQPHAVGDLPLRQQRQRRPDQPRRLRRLVIALEHPIQRPARPTGTRHRAHRANRQQHA